MSHAVPARIRWDGRFACALALSLLVHAWAVKLNFGGEGLFGLGVLWQDRRMQLADLRVSLVSPPVPADEALAPPPLESPVPEPPRREVHAATPPPKPVTPAPVVESPVTLPLPVEAAPTPPPPVAQVRTEPETESPKAPEPAPPLIALEQASKPAWVAPPPDDREREVETARAAGDAKVEAALLESMKAEAARIEQAKVEVAKAEAARIEQAKAEAARIEAVRIEQAKLEAARAEAAHLEKVRLEAARVEAARVAQAKLEAARAEAAKAEAAKAEAAKAEAAKAEAARVAAAPAPPKTEEDPREARMRAIIGKQLEAEAEQRKAQEREKAQLPLSLSTARRYRLFGRSDPSAAIERYALVFSRKIEMNLAIDSLRGVLRQPYRNPMVTVAIRGNGTVESVKFELSSGVRELDEAIRAVVMGQAPFGVFPPEMALEYDVIEIRRTWHFDSAIRLY